MDFVLVDMEDEVSHLATTLSNSHGMWDLYIYIYTLKKRVVFIEPISNFYTGGRVISHQ